MVSEAPSAHVLKMLPGQALRKEQKDALLNHGVLPPEPSAQDRECVCVCA